MMKSLRLGIGLLIAICIAGCTLPFPSPNNDTSFLKNVAGPDILDQVLFVGTGGPNGVSKCQKSLVASSGKLALSGFPPNAEIAVLAYQSTNNGESAFITNTGQFLAHWILRTDAHGQAAKFARLPASGEVYYYAIEVASGEWVYPCGALVVPLLQAEYHCSTKIDSPFSVGMNVRLTRPSAGNSPSTDFGIYKVDTERIPAGALVRIVGGPACNEGKTWWYVAVPNDNPGWVAEGNGQEWYLTPAE